MASGLLFLLVSGSALSQTKLGSVASPVPVSDGFWTQPLREALLVETSEQPLNDPDIGRLFSGDLADDDTRQALAMLQKSLTGLVFGDSLTQAVVSSQQPVLRRVLGRIKNLLTQPWSFTVGEQVLKQDRLRGFVIKMRSDDKVLTGEVYLSKQHDEWLFEDIQQLSYRKFGKAGDFSIEHRTELELEGWIPYGD